MSQEQIRVRTIDTAGEEKVKKLRTPNMHEQAVYGGVMRCRRDVGAEIQHKHAHTRTVPVTRVTDKY